MGICKCYVSPNQGKFEVGRYYTWLKAVSKEKGICVSDDNKEGTVFSPKEYRRFFKGIQCANISMSIYIDRDRELLFVPEFKHKAGYRVSLDCFSRLSLPYREEDIGRINMDIEKELQKMRRNAIRLQIKNDADHSIGGTRFGGVPDTPKDFSWPTFETNTFFDNEVKPRP